eukprot:TRINITY_DN49960_c0_g1_i1.p1 TRINITY_DN49960_c0_g1~~TRINITY_DN49960_c0_g1_i1.p1  ORF type:complete len:436 (-),score=51.70 TRINITY_DN49960_c0_g1_i1:56-1363(-)
MLGLLCFFTTAWSAGAGLSTCSEQPDTGIAGPPIGHECGNLKAYDCCVRCGAKSGCAASVLSNGCCEYHGSPFGTIPQPGSTVLTNAAPSPGPAPGPPSPPAPRPSPDNPLGITPLPRRSDNFFLIIGDWGKDWGPGECQSRIAQMMKDYVARQQAQGKKCLFVGSVGDNFYAEGLRDDAHWFVQWANVYGINDPNSPLHDIPWLAVLGNHDMGNADPGCACGKGCKQFNGAHRPAGTEKFWMPDYYYHYFIEGVDLEVLGIDTNAHDVGGLGGDGCSHGAKTTCQWCGGEPGISGFLNMKKEQGEWHLDQRARESQAKTVLIMQHYDGGLGNDYKGRFESGNGNRAKVLSAYGHAHDQQCQGSREHGCDIILTGGGAGWQGGLYFGFTAVHLTDDGGYQTVLETDEVRIRQDTCEYMTDDVQTMRENGSLEVNI